jgi:hypothetical protein
MNSFFFYGVTNPMTEELQRHIIEPMPDGGVRSFPYSDDNPNKQRVDAWLAEGNTLEEWQPEIIEPASEPVIEETPADSTEEPVTEDGN